MKKRIAIGLVVSMLCTLTGCEKKQEENASPTDASSIVELEEVVDAGGAEEIPESLDYTVVGDNCTVTVSADVTVPDNYNSCTVMSLADDSFDDEDIKSMVEKIFDEGSYFLYMPYNQDEIQFLREKLTIASETVANDDEARVFEAVLSGFDDEESLSVGYEDYEELKFYPDHRTDEVSYFCEIFGAIDGRYYLLTFEKDDKNSSMALRRWDRTVEFGVGDISADSIDLNISGNVSPYSQEESEEIARAFVEKLGYDQYDIVQTNNCSCGRGGGPNYGLDPNDYIIEVWSGIEGYNVYFGRSDSNYSMIYTSESWLLIGDVEYELHAEVEEFKNTECLRVYVDSEGVCDLKVYNPMIAEDSAEEEIVLQSFDKIDTIAQNVMASYADSNKKNLKINAVELGYGIVEDGDNKALVPVWYYFMDDPNANQTMLQQNAFLMINALDGTVIEN